MKLKKTIIIFTIAVVMVFASILVYLCNTDAVIQAYMDSNASVLQGSWSDGKYLYYCDYVANDKKTTIKKVDLDTKKIIASNSDNCYIHANDMTYNPFTNQLLIVHNWSTNYVSILDPNTLELVRTISVSRKIISLAFDETNNRYIAGTTGYNYVIYDNSFNEIKFIEGIDNGYVRQGIECDDKYFYVAFSSKECLYIYDWQGNFIKERPLRYLGETESLSKIDEHNFLIGINFGRNNMPIFYKIKIDL